MTNLELVFETNALCEKFIAWFLDGGGEDDFHNYLELRDEGSFITKYDGDTIKLYEYTVERDERGDYNNI